MPRSHCKANSWGWPCVLLFLRSSLSLRHCRVPTSYLAMSKVLVSLERLGASSNSGIQIQLHLFESVVQCHLSSISNGESVRDLYSLQCYSFLLWTPFCWSCNPNLMVSILMAFFWVLCLMLMTFVHSQLISLIAELRSPQWAPLQPRGDSCWVQRNVKPSFLHLFLLTSPIFRLMLSRFRYPTLPDAWVPGGLPTSLAPSGLLSTPTRPEEHFSPEAVGLSMALSIHSLPEASLSVVYYQPCCMVWNHGSSWTQHYWWNLSPSKDDILLYKPISSREDLISLQMDIDQIGNWVSSSGLKLNPTKTKLMVISRKRSPIQPSLSISGNPICQVNSFCFPGVSLSSDLSWSKHINTTHLKAKKHLGFIYRQFHSAGRRTISQLYKSTVLPLLDYCS